MRDDLSATEELSGVEEGGDPYQPYWDRDLDRRYGNWGEVPAGKQASLAALPKLACLAQASTGQLQQDKVMQLARQLQPLMDNALVNARLLDYPFCPEDMQPENDQAASLAWLVHNSGEIDVGGVRLAALASSLSRHEVELHPIEEASNVVREWGDVGAASSLLLAAVTVSHCARLKAPAVMTQFNSDYVSVAMARPVKEEETA